MGNYGILLIVGNAGFISSTVVSREKLDQSHDPPSSGAETHP